MLVSFVLKLGVTLRSNNSYTLLGSIAQLEKDYLWTRIRRWMEPDHLFSKYKLEEKSSSGLND